MASGGHFSKQTLMFHGVWIRIEDITQDIILPPEAVQEEGASAKGFQVANWDLLQDERLKADSVRGLPLQRATRWSLTCRDIPRVSAKFKLLRNAVASP